MGARRARRSRRIRGVDYVTFTGSPPTGTAIQQAAAINNRGVTMELGGKSPQIVFADADIEAALPVLVNAVIQNGGQTCSAGSRVLIERPVYERVAAGLAERFSRLVAASHEADRDLGSLINAKQRERVAGMVAAAEEAGIPVLARGSVDPRALRRRVLSSAGSVRLRRSRCDDRAGGGVRAGADAVSVRR